MGWSQTLIITIESTDRELYVKLFHICYWTRALLYVIVSWKSNGWAEALFQGYHHGKKQPDKRLPMPLIRIAEGDASVVDVSAVLEWKDAGLLLQGNLLDGETGVRFTRGSGVGNKLQIVWRTKWIINRLK